MAEKKDRIEDKSVRHEPGKDKGVARPPAEKTQTNGGSKQDGSK